ncbi:hypothetical protein [Streptomyces sp. NBC_00259]|uniref:hypothetical protein n=1 Tax=Streptomyces sp. NBC_00259 TaxID=2903643 RepID=UPI002E2D7004|nr:hypothetical protein [Streptomyces sp. NBC_00259]
MTVRRYGRAVGVTTRLLLVVVLVLGVFVMHTVGHPGEGSGSGMSSTTHTTTHTTSHTAGTGAVPAHGHPADALGVAVMGPGTGPVTNPVTDAPRHEPGGMAMDMASLCLAVLGAWALAALLHAAFAGRRDRLAGLASAVVAHVRADPPPRAPDLAQLSILRT